MYRQKSDLMHWKEGVMASPEAKGNQLHTSPKPLELLSTAKELQGRRAAALKSHSARELQRRCV